MDNQSKALMKVLITGATGFIGTSISEFLLDKGLEINYLTTSKSKIESTVNYKGFYWNPEKNEIDSKCIEGVDYIVNLSGKSIGCRWNSKNKKEILESRINSSRTLYKLLETNKHSVKKVISASAIGIYKNDVRKLQAETETNYNTDYSGTINTNGEWVLVTLNLSTLTDLNTTQGTKFFALKVGKTAAYNIYLSNFVIE